MGAREPSWWYDDRAAPLLARVLVPVGAVYGAIAARRMLQAPAYRANIPVICVGNFTAGGTGKTPFVRTLLGILRAAGHTPVVMSRGYGGTVAGPHWIDRTRDRAAGVGDEPLLLAADTAVMVARDRAAGARAIEGGERPGARATVIVMDDGLQNPALAKDLSIAVVDAARGLGNGRCIPAGPLRAPLALQIAHIQAVVLNTGNGEFATAPALGGILGRSELHILKARVGVTGPVEWLRAHPLLAYAGIGVPERFFQTLRAAGGVVADSVVFPDHYTFTDADARRLLARAQAAALQLVTTEKDAARLIGASGALADLRRLSRTLPIAFNFDAANRDLLTKLLADYAPLRA